MLLELIERIRARLGSNAYTNEAAISHGVVIPLLAALGWDVADPAELVPEYPVEGGRVDFALLGLGRQPVVFIEVKAAGKSTEGISDEQLFGYAFRRGVPLCVLTDGRTWSVYFPAGQGSYSDRRVCKLDIAGDDATLAATTLNKYLKRDRVRSGAAFDDAQRDHRDAVGQREAEASLPGAWATLVGSNDGPVRKLLADQVERECGYRPAISEVAAFLQRLRPFATSVPMRAAPTVSPPAANVPLVIREPVEPQSTALITYTIFGERRSVASASKALLDIMRTIASRDPERLPALADAMRGPKFARIARTAAEINGGTASYGATAELTAGWLISLHTSNATKMRIFRRTCDIYGLRMPDDLDIVLPNA